MSPKTTDLFISTNHLLSAYFYMHTHTFTYAHIHMDMQAHMDSYTFIFFTCGK